MKDNDQDASPTNETLAAITANEAPPPDRLRPMTSVGIAFNDGDDHRSVISEITTPYNTISGPLYPTALAEIEESPDSVQIQPILPPPTRVVGAAFNDDSAEKFDGTDVVRKRVTMSRSDIAKGNEIKDHENVLNDPDNIVWLSKSSQKAKEDNHDSKATELANVLDDPETNAWMSGDGDGKNTKIRRDTGNNYTKTPRDSVQFFIKQGSMKADPRSGATEVVPISAYGQGQPGSSSNDNQAEHHQDETDIDPVSVPPLTALNRDRPIVPSFLNQPGAVAITNTQFTPTTTQEEVHEQSAGEGGQGNGRSQETAANFNSNNPEEHPVNTTPQEHLVNATLVDNDDEERQGQVVEAEPALDGLAAIIHNPHFKVIAFWVFVLVVVAVTVPLALLLNNSNSSNVNTVNNGTAPLVCGVPVPYGPANESIRQVECEETCGYRELHQGDYRGTLSVTELGLQCQKWDDQFPHEHGYTSENYPDGGLAGNNYCRNPCGECEPRAWCHTNSSKVRWAYCDVDFCEEEPYEMKEECGTTALGANDYRGNISHSATGKKCLPWDHPLIATQTMNTPELRPNAGLESNYCRNPDSTYAYCYVNNPVAPKEFCDGPQCGTSFLENSEYKAPCKNCTNEECGTPRLLQADYRGKKNTTINGHTCMRWDEANGQDGAFPYDTVLEAGLEENYCRNPRAGLERSQHFAWCFIDEEYTKKDFCDVPRCEDTIVPREFCGTDTIAKKDYRGDIKTSASGKQCRWWIVDDAVLERNTPFDKPFDGLIDSYCRNPSGSPNTPGGEKPEPWCYVDSAEGELNWEYCEIESCIDCGSASKNKQDYTGTQSQTRSGKTCLPWEDMERFLVIENNTLAINVNVFGLNMLHQFEIRKINQLESNFCRNPLPYQRETVFCFVDDAGAWEYCDVPECFDEATEASTTNKACGSVEERQANYRGPINQTASGRECVSWNQTEYTPAMYPDAGLEGSDCRQPAGTQRLAAWCFVDVVEMKWEYCDVPICEDL